MLDKEACNLDFAEVLNSLGKMDQIGFVGNLHVLVFGMPSWKRTGSCDMNDFTVAQLIGATHEEKWAALLFTVNTQTELLK